MWPRFLVLLVVLMSLSLQTNLKIIKTRSGTTRPEPCATICAGETGPNPTFREYFDGKVKFLILNIDISECGFVDTPIVNVQLDGFVTRIAQWTHSASGISKNRFRVYITSNTAETKTYSSWRLNVMWSAFGYNC